MMKIYYFILTILAIINAVPLQIGSCSAYTDCFNCTVNNCLFENDSCAPFSNLTYFNVIKSAMTCGDPLGACKYVNFAPKNESLTSYSYERKQETLPLNYFCTGSHKFIKDEPVPILIDERGGSSQEMLSLSYIDYDNKYVTRYDISNGAIPILNIT